MKCYFNFKLLQSDSRSFRSYQKVTIKSNFNYNFFKTILGLVFISNMKPIEIPLKKKVKKYFFYLSFFNLFKLFVSFA